jgi:hypothetical protein
VRANQPLVVRREVPAPRPDPVLITRRPPPPPDVPFAERQKAMQPDPGRPLAPRQIDNLRAGKPAGPRVAPETPPHPAKGREAPPPRQATPAPPKPRQATPAPPPRQPTPTPSKKGQEPEKRRRP